METDWQMVRDGLAELLMHWHADSRWWYRDDTPQVPISYWLPDQVWAQAGQVVEAMRARGYTRDITTCDTFCMVTFEGCWGQSVGTLGSASTHYGGEEETLTELQCVALAASRALGMEV